MILNDLKLYLQKNGSVSRDQLAEDFAISQDGIDAMLEIWVKKGQVNRQIDTKNNQIHYRWKASDELQITQLH